MQTPVVQKSRLKVRADTKKPGLFELKTSEGLSLGFVLNGSSSCATLIVAGAGARIPSLFERAMETSEVKQLNVRLALILLDRIDGPEVSNALSDVSELLHPVQDTLFLSVGRSAGPSELQTALETIQTFCLNHTISAASKAHPDCASI